MACPRVHALLRELDMAHEAVERALEGITQQELYTPPREGEWSVAQVLAHSIEMEPFWVRKALLVRQQDTPTLPGPLRPSGSSACAPCRSTAETHCL